LSFTEPVYGKTRSGRQAIVISAFSGALSDLTIDVSKDWNAKKITNLLAPAADQDAATKKYVDDNAGGSSIILFGGGTHDNQIATNDARYCTLNSVQNVQELDSWKTGFLVAAAGTLKNFYAWSDIAIGGVNQAILTIAKNEITSSLQVIITGGLQTGSDLVNTLSCVAGDRLSLVSTGSGTVPSRRLQWGVQYELS
jgi:hypothetical protein